VSIPAALLAAIGNGVVAGAVIAATTPAGFDESSFTIGAVSGTILLIAMALSGRLLLGSPA
jgi:predicted ABC-type sugar transport system permease subunit